MIKIEKGNISICGKGLEIIADFGCIAFAVIDSMTDTGLDIESAEKVIDKVLKIVKEEARLGHKDKHKDTAEILSKKLFGMED